MINIFFEIRNGAFLESNRPVTGFYPIKIVQNNFKGFPSASKP